MTKEYDNYTAVTFLVIGLGVGALLALVLAPGRGHSGPLGIRRVGTQTTVNGKKLSA